MYVTVSNCYSPGEKHVFGHVISRLKAHMSYTTHSHTHTHAHAQAQYFFLKRLFIGDEFSYSFSHVYSPTTVSLFQAL